jgi:Fungalysin/Thermolysin Propeptide Motif
MLLRTHKTLLLGIACSCLAVSGYALRPDPVADTASSHAPSTNRIAYAKRILTLQQKESREAAQQESVKILWDEKLQTPRSVRAKDLGNRRFLGKGAGAPPKDPVALLESVSPLYGMTNPKEEFKVRKTLTDKLGHQHVRMDQHYKGLRVVGGELIVHFDAEGKAYQVNGEYIKDIRLSTKATLQADEAFQVAKDDLLARVTIARPTGLKTPMLVVYAPIDLEPRLAYEVIVCYPGTGVLLPGYWRYWIDASNGTILNAYNDVKQLTPNAVGTPVTITGQILPSETRVTGDDGFARSKAGLMFPGCSSCITPQIAGKFIIQVAAVLTLTRIRTPIVQLRTGGIAIRRRCQSLSMSIRCNSIFEM